MGWYRIFLSKLPSINNLKINRSSTPKSNGSVGRNMLKSRPGTSSYRGSESGVKRTIPNNSLSRAKTATKTTSNAKGISENTYLSVMIK
jgi:hypothetical protein